MDIYHNNANTRFFAYARVVKYSLSKVWNNLLLMIWFLLTGVYDLLYLLVTI